MVDVSVALAYGVQGCVENVYLFETFETRLARLARPHSSRVCHAIIVPSLLATDYGYSASRYGIYSIQHETRTEYATLSHRAAPLPRDQNRG